MVRESQKAARDKWDGQNKVKLSLSFFKDKDGDMDALEHIKSQPNMKEYVKALVLEDMKGGE